jgi:hypothetical protein
MAHTTGVCLEMSQDNQVKKSIAPSQKVSTVQSLSNDKAVMHSSKSCTLLSLQINHPLHTA